MSWVRDFYGMAATVKVQAMADVVSSSPEYNIRYIFRWYSQNFNTPLHEVEDLPVEDVIRTFYEVKYEDMEEVDREHEIRLLLETPEELAARRLQEDREDAEAMEYAKIVEAQEAQKSVKAVNTVAQVVEGMDKLARAMEKLPEPMPEKLPPDISMTFIEDDDFPDVDFISRLEDKE